MKSLKRSLLLLVLLTATSLLAQTETGKFRLHKFEQEIGEESYTITRAGDGLELSADFQFTDRGTTVPLKASMKGGVDYTPTSFDIKGSTSRSSTIDDSITVSGGNAQIREGKQTRESSVPKGYFTIAGYAPVSIEMALMRYWRQHGSPSKIAILPSGEVQIADRGSETFTIDGKPVKLERYSVRGLVWGLETVWMDKDNLAALVTRDAEFDHFEAIGTEFEAALKDFVSSAAKDEMAELLDLSRQLPGRKTGTLAFTGATLIDGTGKAPVSDATVVSKGGKIVAAGPASKIKVPADATRIDVKGKYIIPGLWDMHAHYEQVEWGPIYLAAGVTTVRDVGNELEFIKAVRDKVDSGEGLGPHMLNAGIVDGDGPFALGVTRVNTPEDAARWVKTYHDDGFEQMKIYSSVKPEEVRAICADAHKLGMTVTGHIPIGMTIYDGVNDGMDQVNHIQYVVRALYPKDFDPRKASPEERKKIADSLSPDSPAGKEVIAFMKEHGTVLDDTTALFELIFHPVDEPISKIEPGVEKVAPELRAQFDGMGASPDRAEEIGKLWHLYLDTLAALHKAGVTLVAGTDQAVPGYSVYREIELYVQAGFTPMEALQAATIVPARVMKVDKESGTVEAGKRADFDILDANPLDNIHNIRTVHQVVANGILYQSAPLWESVGFKP
ncbi:MAG TPA: amidohydrolase family protein [Terriglobales bacterium]|nr:amidohydrolase family protein [Terriglobales bacterium]